uniref:alpha-1,2-Mannosidase n=1 Tax=Globodera pallida TaxID=36090 RepID=A0A183CDP7_GLOPA
MGLRFYEKYLLLFGVFVASCFLLSGTFVYFRSNNGNQIRTAEAENRNDNPKLRIVHDSIKRLEVKTGFSSQNLSAKDIEHRRNFTREMMKFAWSNYARFAWGENELRPITKIGHSGSVFGRAPLGATIVDALDTLIIMGLNEEFELARDWVAKKFNMKESQSDLSVFETNIRFVGGLLSAFALTKEKIFLDKAREVADLLLPAFEASPFGIPMALVNLKTGRTGNYGWASGGCSILSELGSLELEFNYLSRLTGNQTITSILRRENGVKNTFLSERLAILFMKICSKFGLFYCWNLAEQIGNTCHEAYRKTVTGIGPESFHFSPDAEAQATRISESYYILRPEAIEGWFYLWRVTGNEKYREWCWEAAQAIERHCRVEAGYSGIRNVNTERVEHDDVQQSFFLAETLKYLFLAFSDSTEMPLDQWVFNTEAHPFPIVHATQQI